MMTIEDIIAALAIKDNEPEQSAEAAVEPQQAPTTDSPAVVAQESPNDAEVLVPLEASAEPAANGEEALRPESYEYIHINKRKFVEPAMKVTKCYPHCERIDCSYMPCKRGHKGDH